MWNLPRPNFSAADFSQQLDTAFPPGADPEIVSHAQKHIVLNLYALYEADLGRPTPQLLAPGVPEELGTAIHRAYGLVQDGRRLGKLRATIKLAAQFCPYCGYGPIEDIDHFLQRGRYKIFSIFPLNLVPSCAECNRGKVQQPSANPLEHQIHVYLEDVSAFDFLRVEANLVGSRGGLEVRYFVHQSAGMTDDTYWRLVHHIQEFDLQNRYKKQVNIYLSEQEYAIVSSFNQRGDIGLKEFLEGTVRANRKHFGNNDWRTALMAGLATCQPFLTGGFKNALGLSQAVQ